MSTSRLLAAAMRVAVSAFCWLTALYALVASSSFAYLQFLRPRVFQWTGAFADHHALIAWVWLVLLAVVVSPELRRQGRRRTAAVGLMAIASAMVCWNAASPVLPALTDTPRSVIAGLVALLPAIGLAAIDHWRGHELFMRRSVRTEAEWQRFDARLLLACAAAAAILTAAFFLLALVSSRRTFEPELLAPGLVFAMVQSAMTHAAVFAAVFLAVALGARVAGRTPLQQHLFWAAAFVAVAAVVFDALVSNALSIPGRFRLATAIAWGLSLEGTWAGVRFRQADRTRQAADGLEVYLGWQPAGMLPTLAVTLVAGWILQRTATRADWDDVVLRGGVAMVWWFVLCRSYRWAQPTVSWSHATVALSCLVPAGLAGFAVVTDAQQRTLARYAVYDPSFRIVYGLVHPRPAVPGFDRYLQAHTGLTDVSLRPVERDLVPQLAPADTTPPIFLFVVDSLRFDYLSPYNPAVRFTPGIQDFANESVVFTNAFTRYGGTGLSVPAIWAGSVLPHKQYVKPFHPMNTLEKLLDANGYRRFLSRDSIVSQLLEASPPEDELDRGVETMDYEFCRTLSELERRLASTTPGAAALFAYSLPQDIHMSRSARWGQPEGDFTGFFAPYAGRIQQLDGCFSQFVNTLRRLDLYDDSIIVLTADHGEMLGENGQFGHSYHLFPEVVRVPLIIHLPERVAATARIDPGTIAFSTDITPTIYAALGYRPDHADRLYGTSLLGFGDQAIGHRRRGAYVIAASYGAVYAVVDRNGRRLYIADAVKGGDHLYERQAGQAWSERAVPPDLRAIEQFAIRRHLDETARAFGIPDRQ